MSDQHRVVVTGSASLFGLHIGERLLYDGHVVGCIETSSQARRPILEHLIG